MMSGKCKAYWLGSLKCDLCGYVFLKHVGTVLYDARVRGGTAWSCLCPTCFDKHGVGLGIGRGQMYEYDIVDNMFVRTGG